MLLESGGYNICHKNGLIFCHAQWLNDIACAFKNLNNLVNRYNITVVAREAS